MSTVRWAETCESASWRWVSVPEALSTQFAQKALYFMCGTLVWSLTLENSEHVRYQLIDGDFSAEEAKTILLALIEHKIQFHRKDRFSQQERLGDISEQSNRRIEQLLQTKADLTELIASAGSEDERLSINCVIDITRISE